MKKKYIKPASEAILLDIESPILDATASLPTGEDKVEQQTNPIDKGGWSSSEWTDE